MSSKQSKLIRLKSEETKKGRNEILATYVNKGKKYPYNSVKRGWK